MTRILTTHVGSLPRSQRVTELIFARENEGEYEPGEYDRTIAAAVKACVARQVEAGVDLVSDGEQSKISYATYIKDRITGFEGDSPRRTPQDLKEFPSLMKRLALVAERIERFANIDCPDRVIAGTDCGFSTFAGFGKVDPEIVYANLGALAEGAAIASRRLWGRSAA